MSSFVDSSGTMSDLASGEDTDFSKRPLEERWQPLGAASNEISQEIETSRSDSQLKQLEEEQEQLNSSLSALTTHFAQVQFRLKQVVAAPKLEQEALLQSLEKFAFEGIPDVPGAKQGLKRHGKRPVKGYEKKMKEQKRKQEKLITQLKEQLQEMEEAVVKGASSSEDSPQRLIEKHKQLLSQLSEQNKKASAACQDEDELFNDKIPKEQVIQQITKQIIDLEKFIKLLQGETGLGPRKCRKCSNCSCEHETMANPTAKKTKKKADLKSALQKSPLLYKRKAQPRMAADREEKWQDGLRVNYTVENFGIIDDTDSGGDVPCCMLPKHSGPLGQAGAEETQGDSSERIKEASLEIIKRALAILQIFAMSQFGCTGQHLQDQLIQKATRSPVPPYENLIRSLRKSVENVMTQQANVLEEIGINSPEVNPCTLSRSGSISSLASTVSSSIVDGSGEFTTAEAELIRTIRREFSTCLRDLFEHGLEKNADYRLLSAKSFVNCIVPSTASSSHQTMHAWDVFMAFYNIKVLQKIFQHFCLNVEHVSNGRGYNAAVPRKLSESFGIDVSGSPAVTSKQTLLRTIHFVKSTHERCKRSKESMFRALVSAGLNQKKLSLWCRQIVKCGSLIDENYQSWSCVIRTGFEDVLDILERLTPLDFCLPEDLAIRHLTRANEAFGETY